MTSTRIHDLAVELGVTSEQLLKVLAELGIPVRSHLSALDAGQVALVRARRERDKRRKDEPEPKKGRRRAAGSAPTTTTSTRKPAKSPEPEEATAIERIGSGSRILGFLGHLHYLTHDCPVDLSGDEAHYWDWSRQLDLSYYSKGPASHSSRSLRWRNGLPPSSWNLPWRTSSRREPWARAAR